MEAAPGETSAWKRKQKVRDVLGGSWDLASKVASTLLGVMRYDRYAWLQVPSLVYT